MHMVIQINRLKCQKQHEKSLNDIHSVGDNFGDNALLSDRYDYS